MSGGGEKKEWKRRSEGVLGLACLAQKERRVSDREGLKLKCNPAF